jgi:hypothetical protein
LHGRSWLNFRANKRGKGFCLRQLTRQFDAVNEDIELGFVGEVVGLDAGVLQRIGRF